MFCQVIVQVVECFRAAITKKPHFLPKNGQKKPFFGLKQCFLGPEWAVVGPPTLFSGCWTQKEVKETCFARFWSRLSSFSEPPSPKKPHFLPKNGQKKPFFGLKQCFWGLSGQLQGSPPYFEGAGLEKRVLQVFGTGYRVFWSRHYQTTAFFAQKWPKKDIFWPKTVFWGREWSVVGPPTVF